MTSTPLETGLSVLKLAKAGRFDEIQGLFAPTLRALVTAEALRSAWDAELGRLGSLSTNGAPAGQPAGPANTAVKIPLTFEHGELVLAISVHDDGWLTGLQLLPAESAPEPWEPPAYADPSTFDEREVLLGSGPLAVPGTLTVPHQPRPCAAVVLLGGSGPIDRDTTIGPSKPFKDLAWGLASRGVAVLRFDKVTYAHGSEVSGDANFTLTDEYVGHAVAAIRLLQDHAAVDAGRVFVAGHSLGGTVAPRVAAAEPSVAGLVILAGGTYPLHWSIVRQLRHLASLNPETAAASEPSLEAMSVQARAVDSPQLSASTPASELPFGVSAAYWLDLRGYDPAALAASLGKPILLLQGGRDYQATVEDDLAGWQKGLADSPDVTERLYDADNHFFLPGAGPSTPAEYAKLQHMDPLVIADVAGWLATRQ